MLLDFNDEYKDTDEEIDEVVRKKHKVKATIANPGNKGKRAVADEDLSKPFKEVLKCPFTKRIIEFSAPGHRLPTNAKIYDGTGDPEDHITRFTGMGNQGEWPMPVWCWMFQQTLDGKARVWAVLTLDSLVSTPKEILATEHQLHLPQPPPLVRALSKENLNKYCDYRNGKGHSTNDCFALKRRLEVALDSGKLNHLVKDVRQKGKGGQKGNDPLKGKIINMVNYAADSQKRKSRKIDEVWMNVPIVFPPVRIRDLSEEAIMVEAKIEGYLVRRIHVDEGASLEIMAPRLKTAESNTLHHPRDDEISNSVGNCNASIPDDRAI
nr:reverse transcriptase domain-containing protein [Tanacetum cinerariifolium]